MSCVKAYARVRPLLPHEKECDINIKNTKLISTASNEFEFSKVFVPNSSNLEVFKESILPLYNNWIKGINVSVLCYGQTCSGKTYTCFGNKHSDNELSNKQIIPGITQLLIKKLFYDIKKDNISNIRVYGSFIEIYNENAFDLLYNDSLQSNISSKIRENERGQFIIPDLQKIRLTSYKQAHDLLEFGNNQKRFGNSALHNRSSRSHTIFRLYLAQSMNGSLALSELNIVDLAGSEILSYEFGNDQQEETKSINLSLLALKRVIESLAQKSNHIPYRQSSLTKILQNSLGGNSMTSLLCMISPSKEHKIVSQSTLRFGQIVQKIKLSLKPIQSTKKQNFHSSADITSSSLSCIKEIRIPPKQQYLKESNCIINDTITYVSSKAGNIGVHEITSKSVNNKKTNYLTIILHAFGSGCSGLDWDYLFEPLLNFNCSVIAPDFPGFGYSDNLNRVSSRTEDHTKNSDSSVYVLHSIIQFYQKKYGKKRVILLGYDWGGGLAASYSIKFPKSIFGIVMFHPSWTMPLKPLNSIKTKSLLLWVSVDQLHVYSRGLKMYKAIPNCKLIKYNIGPFSSTKAGGYYHSIGNFISDNIISWLKSLITTKKVQNEPVIKQSNTSSSIKSNINLSTLNDDNELDDLIHDMIDCSIFLPDIATENKKKLHKKEKIIQLTTSDKPNIDCTNDEKIIWSVERFRELYDKNLINNYYQAYITNTVERPAAVRLFGSLPIFDPENISIEDMVKWGIWKDDNSKWIPKNIFNSKRFIAGQQVFIKTNVEGSMFAKNDYLTYNPNSNTSILTYKAKIISEEDEHYKIQVELPKNNSKSHEILLVDKNEIHKYNSPTPFKIEAEGYLFEDKVHCKYSDLITRAKLMEAALEIEKVLPHYNDIKSNNDIIIIQKNCIHKIWNVIDITHFDHVGIHPTRTMRPTVGRLAYFGQGNCHTLASVLSAFLLPFGKILGWEVIFRAGFFYKPESRDGNGFNGIPKDISDHTWLEVCLLPSLQKYVCDPSFDEMCYNFEEIYSLSGKRHPSYKPQCQVSLISK